MSLDRGYFVTHFEKFRRKSFSRLFVSCFKHGRLLSSVLSPAFPFFSPFASFQNDDAPFRATAFIIINPNGPQRKNDKQPTYDVKTLLFIQTANIPIREYRRALQKKLPVMAELGEFLFFPKEKHKIASLGSNCAVLSFQIKEERKGNLCF